MWTEQRRVSVPLAHYCGLGPGQLPFFWCKYHEVKFACLECLDSSSFKKTSPAECGIEGHKTELPTVASPFNCIVLWLRKSTTTCKQQIMNGFQNFWGGGRVHFCCQYLNSAVSDDRTIDERWIGKNMGVRGCVLLKRLSLKFHGGTEENNDKSHSGYLVSRSILELSVSRIQGQSFTTWLSCSVTNQQTLL